MTNLVHESRTTTGFSRFSTKLITTSTVVATSIILVTQPLGAQTQAPNPPPQAPPGLEEAASTFIGWMKWGGVIAGVLGLFISSVMMMVGRRNRSTTAVDGASGIPWVFGGLTVMSFATAIVGQVIS
ncbi:MAG: hypothetical protein ACSLFB_04860 [Acidimicrobiales bacterium]